MTRATCAVLAAVAIIAATARPAAAITVGGGGGARTDCLAVFQAPVNTPASHPRSIVCADGDPTCDADGVVNGVCAIAIAVCANSTFSPMCTLAGVQSITIAHARDDGDPKFDPAMQALQQRVQSEIDPPTSTTGLCTSPTTLRVPIRGPFGNGMCKPRKAVVDMVTLSTVIDGAVYRDADRLRVRCEPAPDGCTAQALFSGTFDRIQRQIFDQSCAVSGCHDSQSRAGDLLLEPGAAYTNLVDAAPANLNANAAGWKRVHVLDATTGDPDTSLLLQKLLGPPAGFGARMPFNRRPLDRALIDVVELWIAAGAPQTGWVPGTD
ncbi:MAG: hypothetical protein E6J72_08850 [Deltaproteobacteria bacterium]|nr:MAG: hypothetical protein E6J72_08850 [Deltaproteobacteria bacterium]